MKHLLAALALGLLLAGTIACSDDTTGNEDDEGSSQNGPGGNGGTGNGSVGGMGGNGGDGGEAAPRPSC